MSYVNKAKDREGTIYDIHDERIAEVSSSDAGKVLQVNAAGKVEANTAKKYYRHRLSFTASFSGQGHYFPTVDLINSSETPITIDNVSNANLAGFKGTTMLIATSENVYAQYTIAYFEIAPIYKRIHYIRTSDNSIQYADLASVSDTVTEL